MLANQFTDVSEESPRTHTDISAEPPYRIALAHDWLVGMRGGERVLDRLAQLFGPTDLYTMVHDRTQSHTPAIDACTIHTSSMQRWPGGAGHLRRWYLPLYPRAVESLRIAAHRFDLLISTSSALIKSIQPPTHGEGRTIPHLCYCHTPPRYLWEQRDDYAGRNLTGRMRTAGLIASGARLREYDRKTASRITRFIANSAHTAKRIKRIYNRDAEVIHPPVDVDFFTWDPSVERESFFLVVSALEPYKRIDLAVIAAIQSGIQLKIAGGGSQLAILKRLSGNASNIEFLGPKNQSDLRDLYRSARALVFPGMEDFGIVPAEAMACGCPVIAFNQGGSEDWMAPGCGLTFDQQTPDALNRAIHRFESESTSDAEKCRTNALRFAPQNFDREISEIVNRIMAESRIKQTT